jgi:G3E family GTPase
MIRLILLTGFLGAGKTTLLKSLLDHYRDTPVGLIVNDFGEVNIDARLLEKDGVAMAELSNGSIFCACIKENFIQALIDVSAMNWSYLFIEAAGLADPSNMQQILAAIESRLIRKFAYQGSVCILDGESFLDMLPILPAIGNQLRYAGAALVNKEDLIGADERSEIELEIRRINPAAPVFFASYCRIDIDEVIGHLHSAGAESSDSTNTPESRLPTFVIKALPSLTMEELRGFLAFVAPFTYRIKGFVAVSDVNYSVSGVKSHIMIVPWAGDIRSPEIVLISAVGIGITGAIADGIRKYAPASLKI